jgi:hypothetical protein
MTYYRSDREIIETALSVLAAYDEDATSRLTDAYEVLGHDAASRADLCEDLYEALSEHDELAAAYIADHAGLLRTGI